MPLSAPFSPPYEVDTHRLEEDIGADNVWLTPDDLRAIVSAAAKIQVQGARLPEAVLKMTGR